MLDALTAIFCTFILAAGWFYLTQSRGVERLSELESPRRNAARRKARRMGAWAMILLAASLFWIMFEVPRRDAISARRFTAAVLLLGFSLITMILCAMVDVYLTLRMRQSNRPPPKP